MSDAIRHCSSWRICTDVTAESWNRRVAFQFLPWFRQRISMAKISPERQPLNSKGVYGKRDSLVPPRVGGVCPPEHPPPVSALLGQSLSLSGVGRVPCEREKELDPMCPWGPPYWLHWPLRPPSEAQVMVPCLHQGCSEKPG